jgi:quinoprotein relay system zinc metallohydrolase 2
MFRREVLLGGVGILCAVGIAGRSQADPTSLVTTAIAPGVHVRRGLDEDASAANGDAIANAAFIVGRDAVAVVDPGGCLADGERLRARIREITTLPIRHVVMSHVHPDHIFGAGAFERDKPQFIGHARLPNAMAQRGDYYRATLEAILGKGHAGPLVAPTRLIDARARIDLGDRVLLLTAHGVAHSDCDLSVFDPVSGTLLTGDLLFVGRVPALDGNIKGWQNELALLKTVAARRAVPGHGPVSVSWPGATADLERYLDVVLRETRVAVKRGLDIGTAVATVGQSERGRWKLFDDYHGHNVTQAFKEVEWE